MKQSHNNMITTKTSKKTSKKATAMETDKRAMATSKRVYEQF